MQHAYKPYALNKNITAAWMANFQHNSRSNSLPNIHETSLSSITKTNMFCTSTKLNETSSTTVEWAMSEMMKNPKILEKAQAEVRQVYDITGDVNESDLHELKYLKLVIKETLRLHPPVPMLLRRENTERCEINGYEIPAKTKVIVNAWAIGRDSNYWNEAERFNPERFINCSVDYKGANFEFIPFGAGRRMCPGMSYGMAVVELSLAQLLYHFDWKLPNGMKTEDLDMTDAFGVTVRRKRDLYLIPTPYHPAPSIQ